MSGSSHKNRIPLEIVAHPGSPFRLHQSFAPAGDQPQAIEKLVEGLNDGLSYQTLLGVTGSGKTYTMANVIARTGRTALVIAPNKTLAAQLYSEFRASSSPRTRSSTSSSYYDYYQPEAYVPSRDLYIEEAPTPRSTSTSRQMRLSATKKASSSGATRSSSPPSPASTASATPGGLPGHAPGAAGEGIPVPQRDLLARLAGGMQYTRNDIDFAAGPSACAATRSTSSPAENSEQALRVSLNDDVIESLTLFDPLTGELLHRIPRFTLYAKSHYVTPRATILNAIETIKAEAGTRAPRLLPAAGKAARAAAPPGSAPSSTSR